MDKHLCCVCMCVRGVFLIISVPKCKNKTKASLQQSFSQTCDVVTDLSCPSEKKEQRDEVDLMAKHRKKKFAHFTTVTGTTNGDFCR